MEFREIGSWRPQNRIFLENPKYSHCLYVDASDQFQFLSALASACRGLGIDYGTGKEHRDADLFAQVAWQALQELLWAVGDLEVIEPDYRYRLFDTDYVI